MGNETGVNIEYFFRKLYEIFFAARSADFDFASAAAYWWNWIAAIGYIVTIAGIFVIVYATMKLYDLRKREEEQLGELIIAPEKEGGNPRYKHIQTLMESTNPSDWRQAIIEADILLDDMLSRQGYAGAGVGDKLKEVESSDFDTLQDAWEAHKVRNQVAH